VELNKQLPLFKNIRMYKTQDHSFKKEYPKI